ncbi:MAG: hypothetical protein U1E27_11900, partial [Kiritimatiellia bacterium]|nr:hypothetical protein [Kiritimatiellia bacterium]
MKSLWSQFSFDRGHPVFIVIMSTFAEKYSSISFLPVALDVAGNASASNLLRCILRGPHIFASFVCMQFSAHPGQTNRSVSFHSRFAIHACILL